MSNTFKIGDLVQLKSGGPVMTVTAVTSDGILWCSWFSGKKHEKGAFPGDALNPYTDTKAGD